MKFLSFLSINILFLLGCEVTKPEYLKITEPDGNPVFKTRQQLFVDYGLCSCIKQVLKDANTNFKDNSLETLYDLSNDDLVIGQKGKIIDSLIQSNIKQLTNETGTYENRKSSLFKCAVFVRSKLFNNTLDSLFKAEKSKR